MLEAAGQAPERERSSRSEPMTEQDARELLGSVSRIVVFRGRKTVEIEGTAATPEDLKGPTGSFRAPLVKIGDTLAVGFNQEGMAALFS